jgi:hypothetical protein
MILPQSHRFGGVCNAWHSNVAHSPKASSAVGRAAPLLLRVVVGLAALAAWVCPLQAGTVYVPNASFESPVVPIEFTPALPDLDYWQKSPQPAWYYPSNNFNTPWEQLTGTFYNFPSPSTFIDNCDGTQAAFLFSYPEVAIFQDYDSIYGTNTTPSHAFNAQFNVGSAYSLTVGVIGGVYGSPPLFIGATLQLSLYYRDAASNMVIVAATTVTNSAQLFPTNTHFVDFSVQVPGVLPTDPWANQKIGVQIASTVGTNLAGGYWDVDNVRLTEAPLPTLLNPQVTNNQFILTLQSLPGLRFEMLAHTNLSAPLSNWTILGTVTNTTGTTNFLDPAASLDRRFYRARQLQ